MKRRDFIKVMGTTTGAVFVPSILNGSDDNYLQDNYCSYDVLNHSWEGHKLNEKDIRIKVLSYAILAPNPHNKQPWLIDLKSDNVLDLYVDRDRLLPQTDPFYRQIHIGQGTFLENLSISATYFGYRANILYFPKGEYSNTAVKNKPIATITLIKDKKIKEDKLFKHILSRRSNKREYDNIDIKQKVLETFQSQVKTFSNNSFKVTKEVEKLRQITINAMKIESSNNDRDLETIKMFRFNNDEVEKYRDGFGSPQNGTSGVAKFFLETFILSREKALKDPHAFGKAGVEITTNQVNSTNTFAWFTTKSNTRLEQVKIGQIYARVNLIATSLGLAIHPISQVLQEYPDMNELQNDFLSHLKIPKNETVQMLIRLGIADDTEHTPRRDIKDMMI